jgi:uncharacterized protein YbjT (DUF2867 family)
MTIAVIGATGLQGGAVTRRLLDRGRQVRALTRDASTARAGVLGALGAEVVEADAEDPAALARAFDGVDGVYCVQNHHISGLDGELRQARTVADVALRTGVPHVVYASAGTGTGGTGVGSWDVKVEAEAAMRDRGLSVTVLRPMAFMELMSAKAFFPPASTWHVMPRLMGEDRPVGWIAVDDLAVIAERVFADPPRYVGATIPLAADVVSIAGCRRLVREVTGRRPRRLPMPVPLFERFVGTDETTMWRWLREGRIDLDTAPARAIHPEALTVRGWLERRQRPAG